MTVDEILSELQSLGNEKVSARNIKSGATNSNQFGVQLGDVRKLAKKIKTDHHLALELWKTKNIEARLLACLILKPNELSADELDALVKSIDFAWLADWFNSYVLKDHPEKEHLREKWLKSDNVWAARSGWSLTASKISKNSSDVNPEEILDRLEIEMPSAPTEVQWTMNFALAYIGIHHPKLRQRAIDIGNKLGIYKDYHVSKGCTSPFAPIWINEMVSRQEK